MTIQVIDTEAIEEYHDDQIVYDTDFNRFQGRLLGVQRKLTTPFLFYNEKWDPGHEDDSIDVIANGAELEVGGTPSGADGWSWFGPDDGNPELDTRAYTIEFTSTAETSILRLTISLSGSKREDCAMGYLVRNGNGTIRFDGQTYGGIAMPTLFEVPRLTSADKGLNHHRQYRLFGPGEWRVNLAVYGHQNNILYKMSCEAIVLIDPDIRYNITPHKYDGAI